jgi:RNA polymerase sigma-70 factor (ECF subfamily)
MTDRMTLTLEVRSTWQRFLDAYEPIRPDLYRYCRHLTRSPWDAEDLAQDALVRAFATLGTVFGELPNPRAWLFRVASNLWIDRVRRARFEISVDSVRERADPADVRASREAAETLLVKLSPQERAAVLLKDVFEFSLEEIAEMLRTTPNAIKAALHRGRGKLVDKTEVAERGPDVAVLDAFCAAFNARDLARMTSLLLDGAHVEIVGVVTEYGGDAAADPYSGSFAGMAAPITTDERGGVRAELLAGYRGGLARAERVAYRGAPILVFWYEHDDGPAVRGIMTFETEGHAIARARNYFFSPDVIAEVCEELGVPYRVNGYSYWS